MPNNDVSPQAPIDPDDLARFRDFLTVEVDRQAAKVRNYTLALRLATTMLLVLACLLAVAAIRTANSTTTDGSAPRTQPLIGRTVAA